MAVVAYSSGDAGAPVLTGQVGTWLAVLNACLVNGYGAKPAAGWTKPFADAANVGCFRAGSGVQLPMSVNDAAVNATTGAREAQHRGFETLTAVAAGTNPFPTVAQVAASGIVLRKSATADATAVPWRVIADDRTVHAFVNTPDFTGYAGFSFGEIASDKPTTDNFRSIIIGRTVQGSITALDTDENIQNISAQGSAAGTNAGHYMPREARGLVVGATLVGVAPVDAVKHGTGTHMGNGLLMYPGVTSGGVSVTPLNVLDDLGTAMSGRGRLRGLYCWLHPAAGPYNDGDTFAGAGSLAGRTLMIIKPNSTGDGLFVVDITGPWETTN